MGSSWGKSFGQMNLNLKEVHLKNNFHNAVNTFQIYRLVIKNLGHHFVILLALGLYSVRLTGYSFLEIPEPVLLFEALKPFCTTLLLISAMTFIKDVTPMSTAATMEGVFG